ncbi:hypothetical protein EMIT0373P_30034 [Pseudomonas chlororaphis]
MHKSLPQAAIDCIAGAKPADAVCQEKYRRLVYGRFVGMPPSPIAASLRSAAATGASALGVCA